MDETIKIQRWRTNILTANVGMDVSQDEIRSEIRVDKSPTSDLICALEVEFTTDDDEDIAPGEDGLITMTVTADTLSTVEKRYGFMDILRISGGEPLSIVNEPYPVFFEGAVTAP